IGIKHTSNDFFAMEQIKTGFPDKLVFNGFDEMFLAGLAMGADGGIGSTYNFMAEKFLKIQRLFKENRISEAQELQKEANRIISALCKVGVMEGEKEVLCQLGFDFGNARAPFSVLNDDQKSFLKKNITDTL
ncbi:MAG: dihydrodipicolinate synthase family protein, partial [Eubacteriales bacterium]